MKNYNHHEIIFDIEKTIQKIMSQRTKSSDGEYIFVESPYHLAKDIFKNIECHFDHVYEEGYTDGSYSRDED